MKQEIQQRIDEIKRGIIPKGYKKGKLGIVCADWEEVPFSTIFKSTSVYTDDLEKYPLYSLTLEDGITAKTERYERSHLVKKEEAYKVVQPNDYAYNPMNIRFGAVARHKGSFPVAVSGYYDIFTTVHPEDLLFMDNFLTCNAMITYYNKVSTGSLIEKQRVHFSQFLDFSLPLPPLAERKKIAEILAVQDRIIALYGQKIEQLRLLKKYCLQKMFPKRGSNVPEVRFPGFTNPWEQRKLSAIVDRITRKNDGLQSSLPLTISAQYGLVDQITYFNKRVASQNVADYYLIKKGEFAYNKSTSESFPFGAIKRLDLYDMGVLSTLYIVFSLRPNLIDSDYMVTYFETDLWHKQISERAEEGARNHGLLNITADDFFDISLLTPCSIDEQKQIGNYFKRLDELILLYQRKRGQETEKKKTLMQLLLSGTIRVNNIGGII